MTPGAAFWLIVAVALAVIAVKTVIAVKED